MNRKGFTLIEMLLVIAIIGVLAVSLFAVINPVEQIRKATDSGNINSAKEIINGAERLYITDEDAPDCSNLTTLVDTLTASGELKQAPNTDELLLAASSNCAEGIFEIDVTVYSNAFLGQCAGYGDTTCTVPREP